MTWYPVVNDLIGGWAVSQSPNPISEGPRHNHVAAGFVVTEAAAHIIAFALNAIAEGFTLHASRGVNDNIQGKGGRKTDSRRYTGPTEGVADANQ